MRRIGWLLPLLLIACDDSGLQSAGPADSAIDMNAQDAGLCTQTGLRITAEFCDGLDNDCDGRIDEIFDLARDPSNCGGCSNVCDFGNAKTACLNGACIFTGCPAGSYDADNNHENGCEGSCSEDVGDELCDEIDNDCDGRVDEDFDTDRSIDHCGGCNIECRYPNGEAICDGGRCRLARCDPGFGNLDDSDENGCEAECLPDNPGPDVCDQEDNDCDGSIDEDFDLTIDGGNCGGCGIRCAYANAAGACVDGACMLAACEEGFSNADGDESNGCESHCELSNGGVEICDDLDNNCDGVIDDGFDKETDVENCGGCGRMDESSICRLPNAEVACAEGECVVDRCVAGFADTDGQAGNGCETPCVISNGGVEVCDALDNDCNGIVDDGFDLTNDVANCGACDVICRTGNATAVCDNGRCRIDECPEGQIDADQNPINGCEYECTRTANPIEICDLADNDCDGNLDEGFDIFTQLEHCGGCDQLCETPHALALCNNGVCDIGGCDEGWFDADGDIANGCEIECTPSDDGFEICDETDNDCDNEVDEDFDFQTDTLNCGGCSQACAFANGMVECVGGQCRNAGCAVGWIDANNNPDDGCEYRCTPTPNPIDVCDRIDNDCDGNIDEGFDLTSDVANCGACDNGCDRPNAVPACQNGFCSIVDCMPGFADVNGDPIDGCESNCIPAGNGAEQCNTLDDDCDGRIDEDYDLERDPLNCGGCNIQCAVINGAPFCNDGNCAVLRCDGGFVDLDGQINNGCECQITNNGIEICDTIDNDCNGIVDDADRVVPPADFICRSRGVCAGVRAACRGGDWQCPYPNTFQDEETRCDGLDNDCNGTTDDPFPELGRPCFDGVGACRDEGVIQCRGQAAVQCTARAQPNNANFEICNGLDDDCDNTVDEDSDIVVPVPGGGGVPGFQIYAYEASRTDAEADDPGVSFARACSKPGAQPWINVNYATASQACADAGAHLCSPEEWGRACGGNTGQLYPYGNRYRANQCNGTDYDADAMSGGNQDQALPSGSLLQCSRSWNGNRIYDLSGNVWEWTTEGIGEGNIARGLRGGSFGNPGGGLTCQFTLAQPEIVARDNVGFRCCR